MLGGFLLYKTHVAYRQSQYRNPISNEALLHQCGKFMKNNIQKQNTVWVHWIDIKEILLHVTYRSFRFWWLTSSQTNRGYLLIMNEWNCFIWNWLIVYNCCESYASLGTAVTVGDASIKISMWILSTERVFWNFIERIFSLCLSIWLT